MATFEITAPDGRKFSITAPEGATKEDALAHFQKTYKPKTEQKFDPTDGMSGFDKFAAGAGKAVYDTGRGIGNLIGLVSDEDIAKAKERDAALMNSGAGIAGNVVGHIAQMAIPGGLVTAGGKAAGSARAVNVGRELLNPSNWKTGATVGAGYGYLQPGTQKERLISAGAGGAGGAVGGAVAHKLAGANPKIPSSVKTVVEGSPEVKVTGGGYNFGTVTPDGVGLNQAQRSALKLGEKLGFKVTPGQRSGSRALQQLEAKLESQPMTSAPFNQLKDANQETINKLAAKSIGETSDTVDWSVLGAAKDRISSVYKNVADDAARKIDPDDFLDRLDVIEESTDGLVDLSILDNKLVSRFYKLAESGSATGKQLQSLASKMGKSAYKQMTTQQGDRDLGIALYNVKDYIDEILASGLKKADKKAFNEARNQYRNLMLLTQRNMVLNPSSGDVSGNALAGLLQQKDKGGFMFGKNTSDLYDAARFSQAFRPLFNDSGTATRSVIPSPTDYALSLPFTVSTKAYLNSPNAINNMLQAGKKAAPLMPYSGYAAGGLLGSEIR